MISYRYLLVFFGLLFSFYSIHSSGFGTITPYTIDDINQKYRNYNSSVARAFDRYLYSVDNVELFTQIIDFLAHEEHIEIIKHIAFKYCSEIVSYKDKYSGDKLAILVFYLRKFDIFFELKEKINYCFKLSNTQGKHIDIRKFFIANIVSKDTLLPTQCYKNVYAILGLLSKDSLMKIAQDDKGTEIKDYLDTLEVQMDEKKEEKSLYYIQQIKSLLFETQNPDQWCMVPSQQKSARK